MQLTGKQIVEGKIITNFDEEKSIQQQGIDLRLKRIGRVEAGGSMYNEENTLGLIPKEGKTKLPKTDWTMSTLHTQFYLQPGYYEVEFLEGCNIPNNCTLQIKSRSSLVRCGGEVRSGQFDAGFHTDNMGAYLKVELPMVIESGARIAQALVFESYKVDDENTYNGQWQGDKQRK